MFNRTQLSIAVSAALTAGLIGISTEAAAQATQQLDRVEVTGSSIKRIGAETALPVQTITREEIQRSGASTVEQLMQTVSANLSVGSLANASASGATTLGISAISLRGLGSQRTLVLVNGRRISPYGYGFTNDSVSVDVNSIPLAAIDRVEILKDGASAIYGSDAIAGVVNFILRREFTGLEAMAEYGAGRNDFIAKPASPRFVVAKVKRLLGEHSMVVNPLATSAELGSVHMAGDLTTLTVGQITLRLTRVEFAMLRLLLVRYGHAVSRETTAKFIGSAGSGGGGRGIDALVSRIRCRLREAGIDSVRIESLRGTGYYLVIDGLPQQAGTELSALAA